MAVASGVASFTPSYTNKSRMKSLIYDTLKSATTEAGTIDLLEDRKVKDIFIIQMNGETMAVCVNNIDTAFMLFEMIEVKT